MQLLGPALDVVCFASPGEGKKSVLCESHPEGCDGHQAGEQGNRPTPANPRFLEHLWKPLSPPSPSKGKKHTGNGWAEGQGAHAGPKGQPELVFVSSKPSVHTFLKKVVPATILSFQMLEASVLCASLHTDTRRLVRLPRYHFPRLQGPGVAWNLSSVLPANTLPWN